MGQQVTEPIWPGELSRLPDLPELDVKDPWVEKDDEGRTTAMDVEAKDADVSPFVTPATETNNKAEPSWSNERFDDVGPRLKVIDQKLTEVAYAARAKQNGWADGRRMSATLETLRARGEYRKLATLPAEWMRRLDELASAFPNFLEVIDYLRVMFTLAAHGDGAIQLDPILLVGPPGCGKSYFADRLARLIDSGHAILHMENAQSNSQLSGSSEFWSNSKPGDVFTALVDGDYANCVFVLNEIDKIQAGQYDPMSSLLSLLEPGTATSFVDQSCTWVTLNARAVIWICTANAEDGLPEPVRDRLRRFWIDAPVAYQGRKLVHQIHEELRMELPANAMALPLTRKAVDVLSRLTPRRIKQVLREGIGRALLRGRAKVLAQDLAIDQSEYAEEHKIGFY